jgi:hypothetical protein
MGYRRVGGEGVGDERFRGEGRRNWVLVWYNC